MVDNSNGSLDLLCHLDSILDGLLEVQIDNVISIVGDGNLISIILVVGAGSHTEDGVASSNRGESRDGAEGVFVAEGRDLDGDGEARSESVAEFGFIDDDDEFVRADLDHLFAEEGSASALDEVEVGVDLIRAIDGHVELGVRVEGDEGDAELLGLLLGADRGGDGNDVFELAGLEELAEALDGEVGGGARSEPHDHAGLDVVVDGFVSYLLLELVLGDGGGHVEGGGGDGEGGGRGALEGRGGEGCCGGQGGGCEKCGEFHGDLLEWMKRDETRLEMR